MKDVKETRMTKYTDVSNDIMSGIETAPEGVVDPYVFNQIGYHTYFQRANTYISQPCEHEVQVDGFKGLVPAFRWTFVRVTGSYRKPV